MNDDPYLYPGSSVLRNKLGIDNAETLDRREREIVTQRISEGVPHGEFGLDHLQAIHKHLFQDVYDWAGELRTVEIAKGSEQFQAARFIANGMADVHKRLESSNFLRGLGRSDFANEAGRILGDVNYVHPFREGNGRTQLQYLKLLAEQAGQQIDLGRLNPDLWIDASRKAHWGDYTQMATEIRHAVRASGRERER